MNKQMQWLATVMICAIPGLALAGTAPVNLLPNGDFSAASQLTGWQLQPGTGTISWNADDAGGDPNSGSIELAVDASGHGVNANSTCFAVTPGAAYSFDAQTKLLAGPPQPQPDASCYAYTQPNCSGIPAIFVHMPIVLAAQWGASTIQGTLAADANSVQCYVYLQTQGGAASVRFDSVFFNSVAPTTPVSLQSFEVD